MSYNGNSPATTMATPTPDELVTEPEIVTIGHWHRGEFLSQLSNRDEEQSGQRFYSTG